MKPTLTLVLAACGAAALASAGVIRAQAPAALTLTVSTDTGGGFEVVNAEINVDSKKPAMKFEISGPASDYGTWTCLMVRAYVAADDPEQQAFVDAFTASYPFMALPPTPTFEEIGLPGAEGSLPEVGAETLARTLDFALYPQNPDRVRDSHQPLLPSTDPSGWPVRPWSSDYPYWEPYWAAWWKCALLAKEGEPGDGGLSDQPAVFDLNRIAEQTCVFQAAAAGSTAWTSDTYAEAVASGTLKFKFQALGLRDPNADSATWPTDDTIIPPGLPGWIPVYPDPPRIKLSNPVIASLTLREIFAPLSGWMLPPFFPVGPGGGVPPGGSATIRCHGAVGSPTARLVFSNGSSAVVVLGHTGAGLAAVPVPSWAPAGLCTVTRFTNAAGTSAFGGQGWNQFLVAQ